MPATGSQTVSSVSQTMSSTATQVPATPVPGSQASALHTTLPGPQTMLAALPSQAVSET